MINGEQRLPGSANPGLDVMLREVEQQDLEHFFRFRPDPEAILMAAFTSHDPTDRGVFDAHWERILADRTIPIQTILFEGQVAGSVLSYVAEGEREVSYWLGKDFWGKGIATRALAMYLEMIQERPLYARAAEDNLGSIRVLERNGFRRIRIEKAFCERTGKRNRGSDLGSKMNNHCEQQPLR